MRFLRDNVPCDCVPPVAPVVGGTSAMVDTRIAITGATDCSCGVATSELSIEVASMLVLVFAVFVDSREELPGDSNGDTLDSSKPLECELVRE